ncbi:MAG: N-acetylmuramoyl-L-alanine amidase [Verrucomicrobiaceae bacterium]|nr:N-acetylmuramoyl-L-alanine amidase [Verrucomicrobiaceae bacterium]
MFKILRLFFAPLLLAGSLLANGARAAETIKAVKLDGSSQSARLTLNLSGPVKYTISTMSNPERLVIDLRDTQMRAKLADVALAGSPVKRIRSGIRNGVDTRLVLELTGATSAQSALLTDNGVQLAVDLTPRAAGKNKGKVQSVVRNNSAAVADTPRSNKTVKSADNGGQRDVIIAIDAGHGGDDPGAIGAGHLQEKRVVLAIARELADIIERERGYKAVLTRKTDIFLPLKTRRDLARKAQADLMISVHADAFADRAATGGSVFALSNRGATSTMAAFLADSENQSDAIGGVSVEGRDDDLVKVLTDLSLTATMDSSLRIGRHVLNSMSGITHLHSERVEQAAFVVLKSPDTPSILVETGFVSNPSEAKKLASAEYQRRVARAIFTGVNRYFSQNPPPNTYLASLRRKSVPQNVSAADNVATATP